MFFLVRNLGLQSREYIWSVTNGIWCIGLIEAVLSSWVKKHVTVSKIVDFILKQG